MKNPAEAGLTGKQAPPKRRSRAKNPAEAGFCLNQRAAARQRTTAICSLLPPLYVYRVSAPFLMSPFSSKAILPVTPL